MTNESLAQHKMNMQLREFDSLFPYLQVTHGWVSDERDQSKGIQLSRADQTPYLKKRKKFSQYYNPKPVRRIIVVEPEPQFLARFRLRMCKFIQNITKNLNFSNKR
jgi:hypothetical protein